MISDIEKRRIYGEVVRRALLEGGSGASEVMLFNIHREVLEIPSEIRDSIVKEILEALPTVPEDGEVSPDDVEENRHQAPVFDMEDWDGFIYRSSGEDGEEGVLMKEKPGFGMDHLSPVSKTYGPEDDMFPSILVVGIGGAGNSMVAKFKREAGSRGPSEGILDLLAVDTNMGDLYQLNIERKMLIGDSHTQGNGTDGSFDLGMQIASESLPGIRCSLGVHDVVIITLGMGGGTGSGMAHIIARAAAETGAKVISIATLPYRDEGALKKENSRRGMKELLKHSQKVLTMPNDFLTVLDPNLPIIRGFQVMDELITLSIIRLRQMLTGHWDGTSHFFSGGGILHVFFSQGDRIEECWDSIRDDLGILVGNLPVREALMYAIFGRETDEEEYTAFRHMMEDELVTSTKEIFIKSKFKDIPAPVELMSLLGFYSVGDDDRDMLQI